MFRILLIRYDVENVRESYTQIPYRNDEETKPKKNFEWNKHQQFESMV